MNPNYFADVEIFVRRPDTGSKEEEEYIWEASFYDMARLTSRTIIENVHSTELDEGPWEIGIREQGDEQYTQRFDIGQVVEVEDTEFVVRNRVASILDHWRE